MSSSWSRRCSKLECRALERFAEAVPLPVEHNAAKLQHDLGPVPPPSYTGSIESQSNEVAHGAFLRPTANVEFGASQCGVWHPLVMLGEVVKDAEQAFASALVARSGLGDRVVRGGKVRKQPRYLALTQLRKLLVDPLTQCLRAFWVKAAPVSQRFSATWYRPRRASRRGSTSAG